ncbi:MAG: Fic family protein [Deltaproteobacteria bacterium]|nr:Fic family protein [Deltaproteobacteria bacterium]
MRCRNGRRFSTAFWNDRGISGAWWNQPDPTLNGLLRAGVAHFWFVTIHPFDYGNGRIARALTDMALAQSDGHQKRYYSLSTQIREDRLGYYEQLKESQHNDGNLTPWLLWFLQTFEKAMTRCEDILQTSLLRAAFWSSHKWST